MIVWLGRKLTRCTDCWWKLMLVFVIGPVAFVSIGALSLLGYGLTAERAAEVRRQLDAREAALLAAAGVDSLTGQEHVPPQRT